MDDPSISLPESLRDWAEARVTERGYASTSDYVGDLVRQDREAEEKLRRLQAAIDEGRASGICETSIEEIIAEHRRQLSAK